jgi:hypothetical protein
LEWHKGKKTRHHRHLSLLRQWPTDHWRVAIFSVVPRTPFIKRRSVARYALAAAQEPLQMKWVIFLDERFNYPASRRAVDAIIAANVCPAGKSPCILNSKRRSRAAFKNMAVVVRSIILSGRRRYEAQRPPKNRLNDLNKRPGTVSAF